MRSIKLHRESTAKSVINNASYSSGSSLTLISETSPIFYDKHAFAKYIYNTSRRATISLPNTLVYTFHLCLLTSLFFLTYTCLFLFHFNFIFLLLLLNSISRHFIRCLTMRTSSRYARQPSSPTSTTMHNQICTCSFIFFK